MMTVASLSLLSSVCFHTARYMCVRDKMQLLLYVYVLCAFLFHSLRCIRIGRFTRMWMRCTWTWELLFELSLFSLILCVFFFILFFFALLLIIFISFWNRTCAISFLFPNTITILPLYLLILSCYFFNIIHFALRPHSIMMFWWFSSTPIVCA